jgi:hypothetical protein
VAIPPLGSLERIGIIAIMNKRWERVMSVQAALSEAVREKIRVMFPPSDCERAGDLLLQYGERISEPEIERVRLDILYICDSNLDKIRELVNLAKIDCRDLIRAAEYNYIDGKWMLKPEFATPRKFNI